MGFTGSGGHQGTPEADSRTAAHSSAAQAPQRSALDFLMWALINERL